VDAMPVTHDEIARIRELMVKHLEETGSAVAERLLQLDDLKDRFTTVMPRDYARVLAARTEAQEAGLDEQATTAMMMEAANG
jgi:glutamate synthase (NADPH) large chain